MNVKQELYGVRGWLALLVLGMCLLGPLKTIGETSTNIAIAEREAPNLLVMAEWATYKQASWVLVLLVCAILFFGGWRLWKEHHRSSVYIAIISLWMANFIMIAGDYAITSSIFGQEIADEAGGEFAAAIIKSIIAPAVWTAYLLLSRRVANTYSPTASSVLPNERPDRVDRVEPSLHSKSETMNPADTVESSSHKYDLLHKLKGLLDSGIITQSEYDSEKEKILGAAS